MIYSKKVALTLFILLFVGISFAFSQGNDYVIKTIERSEEIVSWFSNRIILKSAMVIGIIALGLLISILEATKADSSSKAIKRIIIVLGLVVSSITALDNSLLRYDLAFARNCEARGLQILNNIYLLDEELKPNDNRENITKAIGKLYGDLIELKRDFTNGINETELGFIVPEIQLGSMLYADISRDEPKWVSNPPEDKRVIFINGSSSDPELNQAEMISQSDAMNELYLKLFDEVVQVTDVDTAKSIASFLSQKAAVYQNHYEYSNVDDGFSYNVLMGLDKNYIDDFISLYEIDNLKTVEERELILDQLMSVGK